MVEDTRMLRDKSVKLKVDKEFEDSNVSMDVDTFVDLVNSMQASGFRKEEPILIWIHDGKEYIVDGHHRYKAAKALDIDFYTEEVAELKDKGKAYVRSWITDKQLSSKTISPLKERYLHGLRYNAQKSTHGGNHRTNHTLSGLINTAEFLGKKYDKSKSYIENAGKLVTQVKTIKEETKMSANEVLTALDTITNVELIMKRSPGDKNRIFNEFYEEGNTNEIGDIIKQYPEANPKPEKKLSAELNKKAKAPEPPVEKPVENKPPATTVIVNTDGNTGEQPVEKPVENKPPEKAVILGSTGGQPTETEEEETDEPKPVKEPKVSTETPVSVVTVVPVSAPTKEAVIPVEAAVDEPELVMEGAIIPEQVIMTVFRVNPAYFKESEGKLQVDISLKGERVSCFVYRNDKGKFEFVLPAIENVVFDFYDDFGVITSPILYPNPEFEVNKLPYPISVDTWNKAVIGFPTLIIQETPQVKPKSPIQEMAESEEKLATKRDYTRDSQLIPELVLKAGTLGITKRELRNAIGRGEEYDKADKKGKHAIDGKYSVILSQFRQEGTGKDVRYFAK